MRKLILTALVVAISNVGFSQNYKFGKVSKEELQEKFYPLDSSASAAYLYKKRNTYTSTNAANEIELITEVHVRIKVYNKDGFDWAAEDVSLFGVSNDREKLTNLKAYTYNLIDGDIKKTKLEKDNIFSEQKNKDWKIKKFTMPNLKEGSVVEWSYKIYSPYFTFIDDIVVQYSIPVKKYETKIALIEWFSFNKMQKGYYSFKIKESSKRNISLNTNDKIVEIIEENVPALVKEPYVDNMSNYTAGLKLEVSSLSIPESGIFENYTTSWEEIGKDILKSPAFGGELKKNGHLKEDIVELKTNLKTLPEKLTGALEYVKNKIKWNENNNKYTERGLRKAYKDGVGNIADINLTLVTVLRELGVNANPVLVSTRSHGIPLFPTKRGYNYVIVVVETDEGNVLLDASEKYSLPNVLPLRALNWRGTIVRQDKTIGFINLNSSTFSIESIILNYRISEDGLIEGLSRNKYDNYAGLSYRNRFGSLKEEALISKIEENKDDIEILNFRLSNVKDLSKPVAEMYKFEKEDGVEIIGDKMYITPLLFFATTENPFKLDSREYPIDFGTPNEEKVIVSLQIPEGYTVESLPEDVAIGMSEDLGAFIYSVKNQGGKIQVVSDIKINRGVIPATYYAEIKELFKQIVTKQTEKIVLSKN